MSRYDEGFDEKRDGNHSGSEPFERQRFQNSENRNGESEDAVHSRAKPDKKLADEEWFNEWFEEATFDVYTAGWHLLLKKHRDYGPKNIALAPGGALNGLRVRMWDKMARINHLLDNGADAQNESLRDSFVDLMNYAAIAQLVLDKKWPSE
jgi:hypothetical protein